MSGWSLHDGRARRWAPAGAAAAYAPTARELAEALDRWIDETGDFPAWTRVRDDNTDRVTGVKFSDRVPPMRNVEP